jgi:ABC-2 type transport system permease protein
MREEAAAESRSLPAGAAAAPTSRAGGRRRLADLRRVAALDVAETLRARWFAAYSLVFGAIVVLLFVFGLSESRILGFLGLTRLLVTYIQICMAVLPIFVLVTTVRSLAGDREAGVFEYLLALPVSLAGWYWGRLLGRYLLVFLPVLLAMAGAAGWATLREIPVPWGVFGSYAALLAAQAGCFLGIAMLISSTARSVDVAQSAAFLAWLMLVLFLDVILLGVLVQERVAPEWVVAIALANPLQVFRTAAMMLFDPALVLLGPSAFVILDAFGHAGYLAFACAYPLALGGLCAALGYARFRRGDLV